MDENKEVIVTSGLGKIQALAEIMKAYYPENDLEFDPKSAVDALRGCGCVLEDLVNGIFSQLDL